MASNIIVKYSLLSLPFSSLGLGVWQLKRLEWKKALIARLEERLSEKPIDLSSIDSIKDLDTLEYRRVKVRGHFDQDPSHQIYLRPRPLVVNDEAIIRGRTAHQSNVGVNVITPFNVDGSNLRILVNRGWLALKGKDSVQNSSNIGIDSKDAQDMIGILRKTDNSPRYGLKDDKSSNEWQIRDVEALARVLNTAPIFLDADYDYSRTQGPIGGQTQLNIRNEHLNYAITWFLLAIFSFLMWYSKYGRGSKSHFRIKHYR